jgi:uncharacterized protein (DUF2235 family)
VGATQGRSVRLRPLQGAQRLRFLVHNYEPGDEIYLLRFSPFTTRTTACFIPNAESLRGEYAAGVDRAYQLYRRREKHQRTDGPTGPAMRTSTRHASGSSASGTRSHAAVDGRPGA